MKAEETSWKEENVIFKHYCAQLSKLKDEPERLDGAHTSIGLKPI